MKMDKINDKSGAMNMHEYISKVKYALAKADLTHIEQALELIHESVLNRTKIFVAGNGGSAATASHFVTDLSKSCDDKGNFGRAISLCDNTSLITALANDDKYDNIFGTQLQILANPNDLLIIISASGNSGNLAAAVEVSQKLGMKSVALLGFDGGLLLNKVDVSIHTPTELGEYGPSEDAHSIICHYVTSELRKKLANG